ncbi:MAG: hypothetical protein AAGE84_28220, partial [Cyanobacteria bacterium P01_G01_bin.39]
MQDNNIEGCGIVTTADNLIWYVAGKWSMKNIRGSIPCILGYAPENEANSCFLQKHSNLTKKVTINGVTYSKLFGLDYNIYKRLTINLAARSLACDVFLGRVVFIKKSQIISAKNPKSFAKKYIDNLPKEGETIRELLKILNLDISDVGITGSSLLFNIPQPRSEIDFIVYGTQKSKDTWDKIKEFKEAGIFGSINSYFQRFKYKNIDFDP